MAPSAFTLKISASVVLGGSLLWLIRSQKPQAKRGVPKRMKQAFLVEGSRHVESAKIEVREVDVPKPASGQVLVKVAAAPINPSDDGVWKQEKIKTATAIGIECSGIVVATGGGIVANRMLGRKVAVTPGSGTYAEYVACDALTTAYSLPQHLPVEDGCHFFVNPFTVVGILESVREAGEKAFIHTAGASQLGQMLAKLCLSEGVTLISLVRRSEQKDMLLKLGCSPKHVIVTGDAWKEELKKVISELKIKLAFDAIAGETSGDLLSLLPYGGCVWVYGRLSDKAIANVDPLDLIYRGKGLKGFMVGNWLSKHGMLTGLRRSVKAANLVRKYLDSIFKSDFVDVSLEEMHQRYCELRENGVTGSKMRVKFA